MGPMLIGPFKVINGVQIRSSLFLEFSVYKCRIYDVNSVNTVNLLVCLSFIYTLLVCLSACLFLSNKRQNGWTDWAQILCGTSRDPRKGLLMIRQNYIFIKVWKSTNFWNPRKELSLCHKLCFSKSSLNSYVVDFRYFKLWILLDQII